MVRDFPFRSMAVKLVHLLSLSVVAGGLGLGIGAQARSLTTLGWMAGCWEGRRGPSVTLEMWMPPEGNLMLGASRTVVNGAVRETEQLRLSIAADSLVYTALPSGQKETSFKTAQWTDQGFSVSNPAHDFPTSITYRRAGADSLVARIEGPVSNGTKGIDYPMKRVSCLGR